MSVSVFVFIQNKKGEILLVKNKRESREKFTKPEGWGLPGGGVEDGEEFCEAAFRELEEETSLTEKEVRISLSKEDIYYETRISRENSEEETHLVVVFRAKLLVPVDSLDLKPTIEADVVEAKWFAPDDFPEDLYRSHRGRINFFLKQGSQ